MKDLRVFLFLIFFVLVFSVISNYAFAIPLWSDNTTNVTSGSTYTSGKVYNFGMNWTNTTNGWGVIDNVTFETNMTTGTTTLENITKADTTKYTTFTNSTGIWNISFTQEQLAGTGTYVFKWYANDTASNWNSTTQWIYSISKASQKIILELNGTRADKTYTIGQIANISAVSNATGDNITASFTIFSNFTGVNASLLNVSGGVLNSMYNLTETSNLVAGKYLIFANISATENYTAASNNSLILTVGTIGDGSSCTASIQCAGGYCVHSICRSSSIYCGDSYCDSGESCSLCSADCGACYVPPPGMPSPTLATTPGKAVIYIPSIAVAAKANVTIQKTEGIDFKEISITVINKVNAVYLTITKLDAKPAETPALVNVYRYIRVVPENIEDADISEAKIKFKVNKSWINTNNIDEDTVALQRYTAQWNKLTTTKLSEDTDFVYYEAETPGFSFFSITGEEEAAPPVGPVCGNNVCETGEDYSNCPADCPVPCVEDWTCTDWSECVNNKQTRTCTDENNCGTTVNKPIEERACELPVILPIERVWIIIISIVIIIGILIWKFKLKRKSKRK